MAEKPAPDSKEKRYEEMAKQVADAAGITALFDNPADVTKYVKIIDKGIIIELPKPVLDKLPAGERGAFMTRLTANMKQEFITATGNTSTTAEERILSDSSGGTSTTVFGPGMTPDTVQTAVDKFVAGQKVKPKTLVEASKDDPAAKQKRYDNMAKELAEASGIAGRFGDKAKVKIKDEGIKNLSH